ncbi:MAG: M20/M25/M40 family metallo-hydrolase, partial [Gemmatimonadota bacterium]
MPDPIRWLEDHREESLRGLEEFLRIPSVSTDPRRAGDVRRAAELLAAALREAGLPRVEVQETEGHPIVYAEDLRGGGPTLLLYGHYDVQPEEPVELWDSAPFEPAVRDGELYARGAVDDKGQVWLHVRALEAWLRSRGRLPCRVKVVVEGEEEIGGPSLSRFLRENRDWLAADAVLISDSPMLER